METFKFIITRDGKELKTFEKQTTDFEPFKWLLNYNSSSIHWALRYEGYKVEVVNEQTGKSEFWKP